jgi:hypothetical protein
MGCGFLPCNAAAAGGCGWGGSLRRDAKGSRRRRGGAAAWPARGDAPEAFGLLPRIVSSPDAVTGPDHSKIDETLVHFTKRIDGLLYVATFAVHKDRSSLTLKTFFIRAGNEARPHAYVRTVPAPKADATMRVPKAQIAMFNVQSTLARLARRAAARHRARLQQEGPQAGEGQHDRVGLTYQRG